MRILYFSQDYSIHDHRFLSALMSTDHEVYFLRLEANSTLEGNQPLPREINLLEWDQSVVEFGNRSSYVQDLRRIFDAVKPDVVHAGPVQACAHLVAMTGFEPLLTMSWGSDILQDATTDPGRSEAIFTLGQTSLFACDCEPVAQAAEELGMARDKIVIFPWGVDLNHFSPDHSHRLRSELGWENAHVLLSTRGHERIYGIEILVEGFIRAAKDYPELRLLMLNQGSLLAEVMSMLNSAGMENRVHFAGNVALSDLPEHYRTTDIYLSASRSDGSSISLLEAMACGLPSIVSDIPGNKEWVKPGMNGWLFEDGDPAALAKVIKSGISESALWRKFGKNAREVVKERADWDKNFLCLLDAYQRVHKLKEEIL